MVAVVVIGLAFLTKATGKPVSPDQSGKLTLKMNRLYGVVGLIGLLFGLTFLIVPPLTTDHYSTGEIYMAVIVLLLIFWGTGIPGLLYYLNHKVCFDEDAIIVTDLFGKEQEVQWNNIESIKFKFSTGLLILKTDDKKIKVHQHLVGLSQFIAFVERKTKWTNRELKVPMSRNCKNCEKK